MPTTPSVLGPGIGESQRRLLDRFKRSGECTLAELEAGFELNRETLRAHMKALGAQGLVERSSREAFIPEGSHACTYSVAAARRKRERPHRRAAAAKTPG